MRVVDLLPGHNCGRCGSRSCRRFAERLLQGAEVSECPVLDQERFADERRKLVEELASRTVSSKGDPLGGLIGGSSADLLLAPLPGDHTCREDIYPLDRDARVSAGDAITYRPLGCPIVHFAEVLSVHHGVLTVRMIGPRGRMGDVAFEPKELGICMVAAFEGTIMNERSVEVGETVRFIPDHCMMRKVHSGVVVRAEGDTVRIEGVDLKVW